MTCWRTGGVRPEGLGVLVEGFLVSPAVLRQAAGQFDEHALLMQVTVDLTAAVAPAGLGPANVVAAYEAFALAWRSAAQVCATAAHQVGPRLRSNAEQYAAGDDSARSAMITASRGMPTIGRGFADLDGGGW